jgi:hypothetical protein
LANGKLLWKWLQAVIFRNNNNNDQRYTSHFPSINSFNPTVIW